MTGAGLLAGVRGFCTDRHISAGRLLKATIANVREKERENVRERTAKVKAKVNHRRGQRSESGATIAAVHRERETD